MTTSFETSQRGPSVAAIVAIGLLGIAIVLTFLVAGITFAALAIAFPIAIPFAERFDLYVSAADIELARQFAAFSWAFLVAAIASFAAALVTVVKVVGYLSPASDR